MLLAGMLMLLALPLFAAQASAAPVLSLTPQPVYKTDTDQFTDDVPGQKDLNIQGVGSHGPGDLWVMWQWDDTKLSGGNTGDACALFDTDTASDPLDGKVNFAVCVTIAGNPAAKLAHRVFTCGDGKVDRCTSTSTQINPAIVDTNCGVNLNGQPADPIHGGNNKDTGAVCHIDLDDVGGSGKTNLVNTCSYPSEQPTSAPSDCVLIPRDAFLKIVKNSGSADGDFTFRSDANNTASPRVEEQFCTITTVAGAGECGPTGIPSGVPIKVSEVIPSTWNLDSASCTGASGSGSSNGGAVSATGTISNIQANSDNVIVCTFTNSLKAGALNVFKYIDIDESASVDGASIERGLGVSPVTAADLGGWSITINGPSGFTCTGTTNAAGVLSTCGSANLAALPAGSYTVTEDANATKTLGTNSAAFFNTDPGTPTRSETVNVTPGGSTTVDLGNTCRNTATFTVTGVPSGQTGLFVRYSKNAEATTTDVNMTDQGGGTWTASATGLTKATVVHWEFGLSSNPSARVAGTDLTMSGYPACGDAQSKGFGSTTISGLKYQDLDLSGAKNGAEAGLAGFSIQLRKASDDSVITTVKSDATGGFSFAGVAPGSYKLHELSSTGWTQTEPASGDIAVSVNVGDVTINTYSGGPIRFGNTPLSNIKVDFTSVGQLRDANGNNTGPATKATSIDCGAGVGSNTNSNSLTTSDIGLNKSAVTCVVTFGP